MKNDVSALPPALRKRLAAELQRGERVLYVGRPGLVSGLLGTLPILLFALFWCSVTLPFVLLSWGPLLGFDLPLKGTPPGRGMTWFVAIFIIPFVLIGIAMVASFVSLVGQAFVTVHVVTDDRVVNLGGRRGKAKVESYAGRTINFVKRRDGHGKRGSLEIGYGVERDSDGDPRPLTVYWRGIPDVRKAEAAILAAMRKRRD